MRSKKRNVGDVVKIPLGDGTHTYAHALKEASFAVYDCRVADELAVEQIVGHPVLFFVAVMDHAVKKGRWPILGNSPLNDRLSRPPTFIQDPLNKNKFSVYENGEINIHAGAVYWARADGSMGARAGRNDVALGSNYPQLYRMYRKRRSRSSHVND